jgi:chaperonin GroEL
VTLADLGQAKRIEVGKKTPSSSTVPALLLTSSRVKQVRSDRRSLERLMKNCKSAWKLAGGVAVIKVGAATKSK